MPFLAILRDRVTYNTLQQSLAIQERRASFDNVANFRRNANNLLSDKPATDSNRDLCLHSFDLHSRRSRVREL